MAKRPRATQGRRPSVEMLVLRGVVGGVQGEAWAAGGGEEGHRQAREGAAPPGASGTACALAAAGHVAALKKISPGLGCVAYNLGTGTGTTVLEMVHVSARSMGGGRAAGAEGPQRRTGCAMPLPSALGSPAGYASGAGSGCCLGPLLRCSLAQRPSGISNGLGPPACLPVRRPQAFEAASGLKVNMNITHRRPGDAKAVWAATEFAEKELG